jgi:hypothetical protein
VFEWLGYEVVELVAPLAPRLDEAGGFEHVEVLRDCLPGGTEPVFERETRADLEERLAVSLRQLVEDLSPGFVGERLEDVTAHALNRQVRACMFSLP